MKQAFTFMAVMLVATNWVLKNLLAPREEQSDITSIG
jgi:hypothetical protein